MKVNELKFGDKVKYRDENESSLQTASLGVKAGDGSYYIGIGHYLKPENIISKLEPYKKYDIEQEIEFYNNYGSKEKAKIAIVHDNHVYVYFYLGGKCQPVNFASIITKPIIKYIEIPIEQEKKEITFEGRISYCEMNPSKTNIEFTNISADGGRDTISFKFVKLPTWLDGYKKYKITLEEIN
jgi:hypothetical protein